MSSQKSNMADGHEEGMEPVEPETEEERAHREIQQQIDGAVNEVRLRVQIL